MHIITFSHRTFFSSSKFENFNIENFVPIEKLSFMCNNEGYLEVHYVICTRDVDKMTTSVHTNFWNWWNNRAQANILWNFRLYNLFHLAPWHFICIDNQPLRNVIHFILKCKLNQWWYCDLCCNKIKRIMIILCLLIVSI